jgi:folate-binding protein YgfZ
MLNNTNWTDVITDQVPWYAILNDYGILRVTGEDAATFMHTQLTNDVLSLTPLQAGDRIGQATSINRTAYCTPKGRMLASMLSWREDNPTTGITAYFFVMASDVLEGVIKRLSLYQLRAKVSLADVTAAYTLLGVSDHASSPLKITPSSNQMVLQLEDLPALQYTPTHMNVPAQARYLWVTPITEQATVAEHLHAHHYKIVPEALWYWTEIRAGIPLISAEIQEAFVPQMVNFELIGGVNFKKGCYPGQEIVARSQYLGKLKRRMVLMHYADDHVRAEDLMCDTGQDVYCRTEEEPVGYVVNAAISPLGGIDLLVEVPLVHLESGLALGNPHGILLTQLALPYALASLSS